MIVFSNSAGSSDDDGFKQVARALKIRQRLLKRAWD